MKVVAILPALTLLAAILGAQAPAAKPGSIDGVVTNSVTGEALKKATVTLTENNRTAATDAAGHFHFDSVPPGAHAIIAERSGYLGSANFTRVTVAEEQHVQDIAIKLRPLAVVSGHVLDEDGDPIVRARVAVLRYVYGPGRKRLDQLRLAQSNDLGEFEAVNLPPGRYYFQASAGLQRIVPPHTRWVHPEEAYHTLFYPNALDVNQAAATNVAPGSHLTNIDFHLRKLPAYHVRGTLMGHAAGQPAAGMVILQPSESPLGASIAQSKLQPDGTFDVQGVVSGWYAVSFFQFVFAPGRQSAASQTIHVSDTDVNGIVLTQKPPVDLSGTIAVEGPQPDKVEVQITLSSTKTIGGGGVNAVTGVDGTFSLAAAPPSSYDLQIFNLPPGKYVKSIRFGDREIKDGEIDLTEGAAAPLNIVLGADGGEVDGNVQTAGGQLAPATQVTLAPAEEYGGRSDLLKRTVTDASGNFQIKGIAPGEYKVFAWENDQEGSSQSAEFRKPFEGRSASVTVGPKDKASVQVTVITAGDVEKEMSKLP